MSGAYWLIIACGVLAILYGLVAYRQVVAASAGNETMQKIAAAIAEGAGAYLNRQYRTIAIVGVIVALVLAFTLGIHVALGFVVGGAFGRHRLHRHERLGPRQRAYGGSRARGLAALDIAFKAGAITGLLVVGLGIIGVTGYFGILGSWKGATSAATVEALVALSFGASLISIFARLGGGIFTKGADVGADLVGKVEAGIPEDDPRNPAVIADNVGDNVGDCAGMAADLFETYAVTIVATMLLATIFFTGAQVETMMMYPLLIAGECIAASVAGTFFVKLGADGNIMKALYKALIVTGVVSIVLIYFVTQQYIGFTKVGFDGFLSCAPSSAWP